MEKTYTKKKLNFLNTIQYTIGLILSIGFAIGLVPFYYDNISTYIIALIIIQLLLSLVRLRFLNVFLEVVLLGLAVVSLIPLLGYLFRLIALIVSVLDSSSFKHTFIYKRMETVSNNKTFGGFKKKQRTDTNFQDADFKEK